MIVQLLQGASLVDLGDMEPTQLRRFRRFQFQKMSIIPEWILEAITAQASSPEAQKRLTAKSEVVSGSPLKKAAVFEINAPAPG